jgi:hypothetical protein
MPRPAPCHRGFCKKEADRSTAEKAARAASAPIAGRKLETVGTAIEWHDFKDIETEYGPGEGSPSGAKAL